MNSVSIRMEEEPETKVSAKSLAEQLAMLVEDYERQGGGSLDAFVPVITAIRKEVAAEGVVYATREQAAIQRQIGQLMGAVSQDLREMHYQPSVAWLTSMLEKVRRVVVLWTERRELADLSPEGSDELLGNILIVGWW